MPHNLLDIFVDSEMVKEKLKDYQQRSRELNMEIERLEFIDNKLYTVGSPTLSDMPKAPSGTKDRMGAMVAVKIDLEAKISSQYDVQDKERKYIESILLKMKNAEWKMVIRLRYIDGLNWYDVAEVLFGNKQDYLDKEDSYLRRVHRAHGAALNDMANIINQELRKGVSYESKRVSED